MPSVADLVDPARLSERATPATLRLGRELAGGGAVELLESGPSRVRARIGGGASGSQVRTTELRVAGDSLEWSCTCSKTAKFCKHCAALAITLSEKPPSRRR